MENIQRPFGRGTTRSLGDLLTIAINHLLNGMILLRPFGTAIARGLGDDKLTTYKSLGPGMILQVRLGYISVRNSQDFPKNDFMWVKVSLFFTGSLSPPNVHPYTLTKIRRDTIGNLLLSLLESPQ